MRTYGVCWTAVTCAVGAVGAVIGLLATDGGVLFSIVTISALGAGVSQHILRQDPVIPADRHELVTVGAMGAAAGLALTGLIEFLGPIWIPVVLALVLLSPYALGRLGHGLKLTATVLGPPDSGMTVLEPVHAGSQKSPAPVGELAGRPVPARSMSGRELCRAWRTSSTALERLKHGTDLAQQARLVSRRQEYLDELERRDPRGFMRWLAAGARPASDPSKFVNTLNAADPTL